MHDSYDDAPYDNSIYKDILNRMPREQQDQIRRLAALWDRLYPPDPQDEKINRCRCQWFDAPEVPYFYHKCICRGVEKARELYEEYKELYKGIVDIPTFEGRLLDAIDEAAGEKWGLPPNQQATFECKKPDWV